MQVNTLDNTYKMNFNLDHKEIEEIIKELSVYDINDKEYHSENEINFLKFIKTNYSFLER